MGHIHSHHYVVFCFLYKFKFIDLTFDFCYSFVSFYSDILCKIKVELN